MALRADVAVIGAGLAGASTAFHLVRAGVRDVLVLEREATPGVHASGRNAGLIRRLLEDPVIEEAAAEGAEALASPPEDFASGPLVRETGSVILCSGERARDLEGHRDRAGAGEIEAGEVLALAPELAGATIERAFHTPRDGIADIHAILSSYLAGARRRGARIELGCEVVRLLVTAGRVGGLETSLGRVDAPAVVDASGAWAGGLARASGLAAPPLAPFRRHLFASGRAARSASRLFVWDVSQGLYFRPEGEGYLLSGCDEDAHPAGVPNVEQHVEERFAAKLCRRLPALAGLAIARRWACLRTFAPDRRFVLGPDAEVQGLFYAAGLGGHGVTASWTVGRIASEAVLGARAPAAEFAAGRFRS